MTNRNRTNPVQFYLSDDEQYILNTKFKASDMKSMSAFLRKLILYGCSLNSFFTEQTCNIFKRHTPYIDQTNPHLIQRYS